MDNFYDSSSSIGGSAEEDMPMTERGTADDAPWKLIQKNTFTRWCNEHLKCVNQRLANLETDLSDGLRLISLLEVLSQKKMGKYNKRPRIWQMKLENVTVALEFLEREKIRLVSIGKKDLFIFNFIHGSLAVLLTDVVDRPSSALSLVIDVSLFADAT